MRNTDILICFVCVLLNVVLVVGGNTTCPYVTPAKHIRMSQMLGQWFLSEGYPGIAGTSNVNNCVDLKIVKFNETTLKFIVTGYITEYGAFFRNTELGKIQSNGDGFFNMQTIIGRREDVVPPMVLNSDFTNFILLHDCALGLEKVWLLTRAQTPSKATRESVKRILADQGFYSELEVRKTHCEWRAL